MGDTNLLQEGVFAPNVSPPQLLGIIYLCGVQAEHNDWRFAEWQPRMNFNGVSAYTWVRNQGGSSASKNCDANNICDTTEIASPAYACVLLDNIYMQEACVPESGFYRPLQK